MDRGCKKFPLPFDVQSGRRGNGFSGQLNKMINSRYQKGLHQARAIITLAAFFLTFLNTLGTEGIGETRASSKQKKASSLPIIYWNCHLTRRLNVGGITKSQHQETPSQKRIKIK